MHAEAYLASTRWDGPHTALPIPNFRERAEQTYRRGDAPEKLMEAWAGYCEQVASSETAEAAVQSGANGDTDTTRRYWAAG
jgi:hypothetical protein